MKSAAFIVIVLAVGILATFIFLKSGLQVSFNKTGPTPSPQASDLPLATQSSNPSATIIEAGASDSKIFEKYQITIPSTWNFNKSSNYATQEILTLTSGEYKIVIKQDEFDGAACAYSDQPIENLSQKRDYAYFKQLTTKDGGLLRRGGDSESSLEFIVCEKRQDLYQTFTKYGEIYITFPINATQTKIGEVDTILASLKKI